MAGRYSGSSWTTVRTRKKREWRVTRLLILFSHLPVSRFFTSLQRPHMILKKSTVRLMKRSEKRVNEAPEPTIFVVTSRATARFVRNDESPAAYGESNQTPVRRKRRLCRGRTNHVRAMSRVLRCGG